MPVRKYSKAIIALIVIGLLLLVGSAEPDPVVVKKTVIGEGPGFISIMVEIKCLDKDLNNIQILERIDYNKIIKCSGYKILTSFSDIYNDAKILEHPVDLSNDTIYFGIDHLSLKERIRYEYTIGIKKLDNFNASTYLRIGGNYPDVYLPSKIDPLANLNVTLEAQKFEGYVSEGFSLSYVLNYSGIGNLSIDNITLVPSPYCEVLGANKYAVVLKTRTPQRLSFVVKYMKTGKFQLPGINIVDKYFLFSGTTINITNPVDTMLNQIGNKISAVVVIMGFCPSLVALITLINMFKRRFKKKD